MLSRFDAMEEEERLWSTKVFSLCLCFYFCLYVKYIYTIVIFNFLNLTIIAFNFSNYKAMSTLRHSSPAPIYRDGIFSQLFMLMLRCNVMRCDGTTNRYT